MERFDFVNRVNADYIDRLYEQYQHDPRTVEPQWAAYFAGMDADDADAMARAIPGSLTPVALVDREAAISAAAEMAASIITPAGDLVINPDAGPVPPFTIGVHKLVHAYRELGHFVADLDPLGHNRPNHPLLELTQFNITDADLDRPVGGGGFLGNLDGSLRDLLRKLRDTYCRTIGVEYMGISEKAQREWLAQHMEPIYNRPNFSAAETHAILFQLVAAEEFERFLHTRQKGQKRFSLEGGESLIPLLNTLVDDAAGLGVDEMCFGMSHRGRLSVLSHVMNKPYEIIFSEFEGTIVRTASEGDGDVKYHLGYANDRPTSQKKTIHLSLSPNPSHLELINPIVEGIVRCKQKLRGDKDHGRVVPILLHGDAAFTGQGIVHETLGLSELPFYRTGGTIHVIVNNQVGFTTPPNEGRFTPYPTDVAKMIQGPVFHVNGDDPEAVVHAGRLAIAFRQQFKCDVFIDLWCYRRHGHNEVDEPTFTQPVMYRQIASHPTTRTLYAQQLISQGKLTEAQHEEMKKVAWARMEAAATAAKEFRPRQRTATFNNLWKQMVRNPADTSARTSVSAEVLGRIAEGVNHVPAGFTPHPKLKRLYAERLESVKSGKGIDWGCGEMLALGALLLEGTPVRFAGQDVQRGTFSHRQAVLNDYETGLPYTPLNYVQPSDNGHPAQAMLTIINTMLSELAVVGFEYGFSSADPRNLVIWEAQFGDFVNGAQPVIDQFIAAAESKWQLMNGLVMLLPHGFEGQGPEHSNAYLDRFLSLCAEENLQVCVPSTPAQYFHVLRRQIHRKFRKPLILMMPKSLLRFAPSASRIEEFTDAQLQLVIDDPANPERDAVRRVLMCSGKVFYSLSAARDKEQLKDVAIVRVEQLYPFPKKEIQAILAKYRKAREVAWVQEEPKNRGAWGFIHDRIRALLPDPIVLNYFGRGDSASPATGSYKMHQDEEKEIIAHALELPLTPADLAASTASSPGGAKTTGRQETEAARPLADGAKGAAPAASSTVAEIASAEPATARSSTAASD